ncbi:MAG: HAMP domain-containing protein [Treponema sp.]|nr:HAMP domain-containing protein [Treponema sp.]
MEKTKKLVDTAAKQKRTRRPSIIKRLVLGISALTLILLAGLGTIIYFRISKLNTIQFEDKLNTTIQMTDSLIKDVFESIRTSVSTITEIDLVRRNDDRIKSYVNLKDPSGKIPMKPLENSEYEAEVYKMARAFVQEKAEVLGVSMSLQSTGAFVRFPEEPRSNGYDARTRSWYKGAVNANGKVNFSAAYTTSAGEMVIVASKIIKGLDNAMRGVITIDADLSNLSKIIVSDKDGKLTKTSLLLVDHTGSILVNNIDHSVEFKKINEIGIKGLESYTPGDTVTFNEKVYGVPCEVRTVPSQNGIIPLNYIVLIPQTEVKASNNAVITTMIVVMFAGFILSIIVAAFFGNFIGRPLVNVTKILKNISDGDGDLTERLPVLSKDEIGRLSKYFNKMMAKISNTLSDVIQESNVMNTASENVSDGMSKTASALTEISANVENIRNQILNQSAGVEQTSQTMQQIAGNITKLKESIESQASNVVQSSSSIEEMVANIRSVNTILTKNSESVMELSNSAEQGRALVSKTVELTNNISVASEGLMDASKMIQSLASQTNLLSMNAAIEAAHAGESGRGFAVVANEIRKLAEDSNKQGKKISEVLENLRKLIVTVTESTTNIQKQFDVIFSNTQTVTQQEQVIKNAMDEQATGGQQVLEAIHQINAITEEVKDGAATMQQGGQEILIEIEKLTSVTSEINNGIKEITTGVQEINNTMQNINSQTQENHESITKVSTELSKFKVTKEETEQE